MIPSMWRDRLIDAAKPVAVGRVCRMVGLHLEVEGVDAAIGEAIQVDLGGGKKINGEVVALNDGRLICMPLGDLAGVRYGAPASAMKRPPLLPAGFGLLGRVIDSEGNPIDGKGPIFCEDAVNITNVAPPPMSRELIREQLSLGVRVLDTMVPCGKGQRLGVFAGAGVGKSSLLSMIIRGTSADVKVLGLVGERGREVREFIENDLGDEGLKSAVVVVATSDQPPLLRIRAALAATRIAEWFRDQDQDVLLVMDSLTRLAMAQREVGLSSGEPPSARGYPPSVTSLMARLLERAGNSARGSITGLYSVLVDGDDMNDPIADSARSILDGHIALSRSRAQLSRYPAVAILESISRLETSITDARQKELASTTRRLLASLDQARDLIEVGAYRSGSNALVDEALAMIGDLESVFCQGIHEPSTADSAWAALERVFGASR
ncbi:MAG: FliI/YscN family ATPase [Acidimicrobiales bacterium]